jgi:hypothetical protein
LKCCSITGTHAVDVTGFMNDGHPVITVTYRSTLIQFIGLYRSWLVLQNIMRF